MGIKAQLIEPVRNVFIRSDQYNFVRRIPSVMVDIGNEKDHEAAIEKKVVMKLPRTFDDLISR